MAFVRKHGNQLALVHGERDSKTGKVNQRILFSLYSRAEAEAAIGEGESNEGRKAYFQNLMTRTYPRIKFRWDEIKKEIKDNLEYLPEMYGRNEERLFEPFSKSLDDFAHKIIAAESFMKPSNYELLKQHENDLIVLRDIIDYRLQSCKFNKPDDEEEFDRFNWHYMMDKNEVPNDIEEWAERFYETGEYDKAERIFKFLVRCFDNYAEGYNYLGLICDSAGRLKEAAEYYEKTVEVGRSLFGRVSKKDYWYVLETRPYVRGLRNLAFCLLRLRRYREALEICDKLDSVCGDSVTANIYRASVYLNQGKWLKALEHSGSVEIDSSDSFIIAFASYELGDLRKAGAHFLHAALNEPLCAAMILGAPGWKKPKNNRQVDDHNSGVYLKQSIGKYLGSAKEACKHFSQLFSLPQVKEALSRIDELEDSRGTQRDDFKKLCQMRSFEFAQSLFESLPPNLMLISSKKSKVLDLD